MATVTKKKVAKKKAHVKKMTVEEFEKVKKKTWYKKLLEIFRLMNWCKGVDEMECVFEEQIRKHKIIDHTSAFEYLLKKDTYYYLAVYDRLNTRGLCSNPSQEFENAYCETITPKDERAVLRKFKIKIKDVPLKTLQGLDHY